MNKILESTHHNLELPSQERISSLDIDVGPGNRAQFLIEVIRKNRKSVCLDVDHNLNLSLYSGDDHHNPTAFSVWIGDLDGIRLWAILDICLDYCFMITSNDG